MSQEINENMPESRVYEVGFHIVPTVAENDIPAKVAEIKGFIEKKGGTFIAEGAPTLRNLAYKMSKTVKAVKSSYSKAYFGWIKFTLTAEGVVEFKKELDAMDTMLRYLIISTVEESTLYSEKKQERAESKDGAAPKAEELDKTVEEPVN